MGDEKVNIAPSRDRRWAALLRHANDGDRAAYVQFLTDITPVLRGIIMARCGGRTAETEDILQNTLIAIHEKRHTWRETDPVSPWLYAIARYKVADTLRKQKRDRTVRFDGDENTVPDETIIDPSVTSDLNKLLTHLDEVTARIVRDIKLNGLSAEETGARCGMTAGAVRVALHRAMAKLSTIAQNEDETDVPDKKSRR